jgi:hypothetical protein
MSKVNDPELLKQLDAPQAGDPGRVQGGWEFGTATDLLQGVAQGLIDPIEGLVQLAERSTDWKIAPQGVRDWARNYRKQARSTMMGMGGEIVGNIAPAFVVPGAGGASFLSRALGGAVAGGLQPVSGGSDSDYWRTKRDQMAMGAVGGSTLPALAGQVARAGPALAHAAGHAAGIPRAILNTMHGLALPITNLAQRAATSEGGREGAVAGMLRGQNPLPPPDRLYVSPPDRRPPPAPPSASDDDDVSVNRAVKSDRRSISPRAADDQEDSQ